MATSLVGPNTATLRQARRWARDKNAASVFVDAILPALYGAVEAHRAVNDGVGLDFAAVACQSAKETGYGRFGGVLTADWRNTAGIKIAAGGPNDAPDAHERFDAWCDGARAHVNHLSAYTGLDPVGTPHGRYHTVKSLSWAGSIETVEDLGARWAPNPEYGRDIVRMMGELVDTDDTPPVEVTEPEPEPEPQPEPAPTPEPERLEVEIIPRSDWGARAPKSRNTITTPTTQTVQHHTVGLYVGPAGMRSMQRFHQDDRGWADIAYSLIADVTLGVLFEGRGKGVAGAHTAGLNSIAHGLAVTGNFQTRQPTEADLLLLAGAVRYGRENGWWRDGITSGHRDHAATACPGNLLYPLLGDINALSRDVDVPILKPEQPDKPPAQDAWYVELLSHLPLAGASQSTPRHVGRVVQAVLAAHRVPPAQSFDYNPTNRTAIPDGIIGNHSDRAIRGFQEREGLVVDGIVGPATYGALFPGAWPNVRQGDSNLWAGIVQALLAANNLPPHRSFAEDGIPDRVFGARSDEAARAFQRRESLGVDGIVGRLTYTRAVLG